ncbi:hypothetical protein SGCZBJ_00020 [Caulobacter zeae]|uniref:Uncharacterized protein n=1 Tax=Caulobacter zeae TaxID=2055137 RepID=A0A2N5DS51_9CAUL|nr:hypothetical protein [Caulobacter zeae]PLR28868.1 hypothetical protein SGCZBJ_00020 [Caulobacter zeae]
MRILAAAVVAILALQPLAQASACTPTLRSSALPIDQAWPAQFGEWFARADGVYLVRVAAAGALDDGPLPMACDYDLPPPPPVEAVRGKAERAEAMELARRYDAARKACSPGKARIHVVEALKGAAREDWVEEVAFIQVVDGPPSEPIVQGASEPIYAAGVGPLPVSSCMQGWFARRMSLQSTYVVLTTDHGEHPGRITHVFLADDPAPFLAEARRLARPAP